MRRGGVEKRMRIITGKFKGRALTTVRDISVRPATDRVKGTIFNVLQNRLGLGGAAVLDLFAGSGSLGFEALSRGAAHVVFVDDNDEVVDLIEKNAEKLNCAGDCDFIASDVFSFIERNSGKFDLIFADPPYVYEELPDILTVIFNRQLLKSDGFLIMEHSKRTMFETSPLYRIVVQKEFGNTRVSFFTHNMEIAPT